MSFDITEFVKSVPNRDNSREQIEYIYEEYISPDPDNFYSMDGISELAANIETAGLQQPIRVYPDPSDKNSYIILSGHRRFAALQLLMQDDHERWGMVPCIVERDDVPLEARKLRLLLANRDTRKLTSADLDRQAADMEKYIVSLKEQGYSFPGRLSDYVAQCLSTSKTKLNRLKIIREGLIPEWRKMWEDGKINDSVGYSLAHLDKQDQNIYARFYHDNPKNIFAWSVDDMLKRFDALPKECEKRGGGCGHLRQMKFLLVDPNEDYNCRGCCMDCYYLGSCKRSCPEADEKKEQINREKKERKDEEKLSRQIREAPALEYLTQAFSRVYGLMQENGLSVEDMLTCDGKKYHWNEKEFLEHLKGNKITAFSKLPFGWGVGYEDCNRIICAAELLGVSIDYLLTGKDAPKASGWKTGEPKEDGRYLIAYSSNFCIPKSYDVAAYTQAEGWVLFGEPIAVYDYHVFAWCEQPGEDG